MKLNLQLKLNILILVIAVLFIIILAIMRYGETKKIETIFESELKERQKLLENILKEKGNNFYNFIYDYTYWDEMYNFVNNKNREWARINIDVVLTNFNTHFAWVFDKNFNLIYHYNVFNDTSVVNYFSNSKYFTQISEKKFLHFYTNIADKIVEIRTAPIQPSADIERKTPPNGYFIVGRVWDAHQVESLDKLMNSKFLLINYITNDTIKSSRKINSEWTLNNSISFRDINNSNVAELYVMSDFRLIDISLNYFNNQIIYIILLSVITLISLTLFLNYFVSRPLSLIQKSLELENPSPIKSLYTKRSEFGRIAYLMHLFFIQKEKLVSEIEERKKVEKALVESEALYKTLFESSDDIFFILDEELKIVYSNKRFKEVFLKHRHEESNINYRDFLPLDDFDNFSIEIKDLFRKKLGPYPVRIKISNMYWDFEFLSNPITLRGLSLVLVRLTDITELKKLEREAQKKLIQNEQSERLASLGMVVAGVAHEINNPSSFILTNIKYLKNQFELITPILEEYLANYPEKKIGNINLEVYKKDLNDLFFDLTEGAKRIHKLVSELKTFSTSREELQFEEIVLDEIIKITLRFTKTEIKQKKINVINLLNGSEKVYSDRQKLSQIIFNLIINSIQAINKEDGEIKIEALSEAEHLVLEITDNGVGIPEDKIKNIFDPFFTTKNFTGGTGIGLSLAKSLADKLNIEISVESQLNVYTKFKLKIPKAIN